MYVKLICKYQKDDEEDDLEDVEDVDSKHELELRDLFRISSELNVVLIWDTPPDSVRRYINTGGDEELYALASKGVGFPSALRWASSMKTEWSFYDIDHTFLGAGLVSHHS